MKNLLATLLASALYAAPAEITSSDEVALLDPIPTPTFSIEEIQIPAPPPLPKKKSTFIAVGLSYMAPGLGHTYLGDFKTAGGLFGSTAAEAGLFLTPSLNDEIRTSSFLTAINTYRYGIYAAYRDVRAYNRQDGYAYKMPSESLAQLIAAPFQWSVIKKPAVWGGLLGALTLASTLTYFTANTLSSPVGTLSPIAAFPVGIGEEAFFRGFIQPLLAEELTPWGSIAFTSLAFGAAHISNVTHLEAHERKQYYTISLPLITTLGAYLGWLTYDNNSLKESVALHVWYDFTLFALNTLANQTASTSIPTSFSLAIPF